MGNNQPTIVPAAVHAIYGQPKNLVLTNGQKTHVVTFPVADEKEGQNFINKFNVTEGFSKRHLLLSNSFTMDSVFLCTNSKNFNCTFPFYPYSLEQEIQRRALQKQYLSKQQLTNIIYQIIDGARNFDRVDEKVGDIRPSQILLDQSKKRVKLVNFFTSPNELKGSQKAHQLKEKAFLAPQQLKSLQKGNPNPEINVHKADSFSIGLTILAIGNLKKLHDQLYDLTAFSFSWTQLSNQLQTFENRYGHFLAEIVKGFVQNQPRNRLYIGEVGALLQFYEKHIFELLPFEPDFALLEKAYSINYTGPRSEGFTIWLHTVRQFWVKKVVVEKKVIVTRPLVPIVVTQAPKVKNSRIQFYYTSPSVVKGNQNQ